MKCQKFIVLFSLILFFCGCASTPTKTQPPKLQHNRPVGFWENKESVVQVLHFYNQLTTDNNNKPILDDKGKFTASIMFSIGTGFVVNTNGLVLTNNHIVNEKCPIVMAPEKITTPLPENCAAKEAVTPDQFAKPLPQEVWQVCTVDNGIRHCHPAKIVAADAESDIAKLHTDYHFPRAVEFADDSELVLGDEVYYWGNVFFFLPPSPFFGRYINRLGPPYYTGENFSSSLPLLLIAEISVPVQAEHQFLTGWEDVLVWTPVLHLPLWEADRLESLFLRARSTNFKKNILIYHIYQQKSN